jgi:hypothetical protein
MFPPSPLIAAEIVRLVFRDHLDEAGAPRPSGTGRRTARAHRRPDVPPAGPRARG